MMKDESNIKDKQDEMIGLSKQEVRVLLLGLHYTNEYYKEEGEEELYRVLFKKLYKLLEV